MPVGNSKVKLIRQGYFPIGNYFRLNGNSFVMRSPDLMYSSATNNRTVPSSNARKMASLMVHVADEVNSFALHSPQPAHATRQNDVRAVVLKARDKEKSNFLQRTLDLNATKITVITLARSPEK